MKSDILKKPLTWFAVFNFVIYTAVFMGRILRDSLLFTQPMGEKLLPLVFILNAAIITWVGSSLDNWERKLGREKLFGLAFGGGAVFLFGFACLFHPSTSEIFGFLKEITYANLIITFLFYLLSEIPIFLSMNLIWILAAEYFTEQQGQKDYPRIASVGLIGIAFASLLTLANGWGALPLYYLNFLWVILSLFLWGIAWGILKYCPKLLTFDDFSLDDLEEDEEESKPFWQAAKEDWNWAKKYPFLWLFTIVTICNFVLLAIFDQTLANGARHIGITDHELSALLAKWTMGFGIFAALFQWFVFPRLLNRMGVAKVNLFAPSFMMLGAISYLCFASDFLDPIWTRIKIDTSVYLLEFIIFARVAGWCAEFLFNQSMLPFVYGAMPSQDESRGRLLVEGPVTAITNGCVGGFLLIYFSIFKEKIEGGYGYKLDLLFVIAGFAAALMWLWSKQMIPQFQVVLKKRAMEGEESEDFLVSYRPELVDDIAIIEDEIHAGKQDNRQFPKQLRLLRLSKGKESIPTLRNFALDTEISSENRASAMLELIKSDAVEAFDEIWEFYTAQETIPDTPELEALGKAGKYFGRSGKLKERFEKWLNQADPNKEPDKEQVRILLHHLSKIGLDGALIVGTFIDKYTEGLIHFESLSQLDLYLIAAELGSDRFYPRLAETARNQGMNDWHSLVHIEFFDHKNVLDAFALLLPNIEDIHDGATLALSEILQKHLWLSWPLLWMLELPADEFPEGLEPGRPVWPLILARAFLKNAGKNGTEIDLPLSNLVFFEQFKHQIGKDCANELSEINWDDLNEKNISDKFAMKSEGIHKGLNYRTFLVDRLENPEQYGGNVGTYTAFAEALFELSSGSSQENALGKAVKYSLDQYRTSTILFYIFRNIHDQASDWLNRRRRQWLTCYLLVLACRYPSARNSINKNMTDYLLMDQGEKGTRIRELDIRKRDNILSQLEQSGLPRNIFTELRNDLNTLADKAHDSNVRNDYIGKELRTLEDKSDTQALWTEVIQSLNDDLLKGVIISQEGA